MAKAIQTRIPVSAPKLGHPIASMMDGIADRCETAGHPTVGHMVRTGRRFSTNYQVLRAALPLTIRTELEMEMFYRWVGEDKSDRTSADSWERVLEGACVGTFCAADITAAMTTIPNRIRRSYVVVLFWEWMLGAEWVPQLSACPQIGELCVEFWDIVALPKYKPIMQMVCRDRQFTHMSLGEIARVSEGVRPVPPLRTANAVAAAVAKLPGTRMSEAWCLRKAKAMNGRTARKFRDAATGMGRVIQHRVEAAPDVEAATEADAQAWREAAPPAPPGPPTGGCWGFPHCGRGICGFKAYHGGERVW
jgi:hypothetical protein